MTQATRRRLLGTAPALFAGGLAASLPLATSRARAQSREARLIRIVVPFSAGGPTDFIARQFATALAAEMSATVIVDNRPGASGNIGTQLVVDGPADGLTLVHTTAAMQAVNPLMYPTARFHPNQDLVPVGITGSLPNVLVVHPDSGIKTVPELLAAGRQRELTYATFGPGSSPHIYAATLQHSTGLKAVAVPYKGSGAAIVDMLAGQIDFMFDSLTTSVSHVRAGKLTGLALTSAQRSRVLPEVPTLKEAGIQARDLDFWFALQVKAGTPSQAVAELRDGIYRAVQRTDYIEAMQARGVETVAIAPAALQAHVQRGFDDWSAAARAIDLKAE